MTSLQQYALLLALIAGTIGFVAMVYLIARSLGRTRPEPGKDVPFTGGVLSPKPAWVRYHVHYYGFALLFLAFDMEMVYMFPWAVVFRKEGIIAFLDMFVFIAILVAAIVYAWKEKAFDWER